MQNLSVQQYPGKELEAMSFALTYHKWILKEFEPFLGKTIAEVGAGNGSVSKLLLEKSINSLFAFEPSQNIYPLLEKELRHEKRATVINDFFSPKYAQYSFDSIIYINVLEHIEDDKTELTNVLQTLKPNGHLLLFVPALEWLYSNLDSQIGHFRRYKKRELTKLVSEVGFNIVKARYFDMAGIIPWYINFVLLKNYINVGNVSLYDKLVVPIMKLIENTVAPPIGKNILLIGRKNG